MANHKVRFPATSRYTILVPPLPALSVNDVGVSCLLLYLSRARCLYAMMPVCMHIYSESSLTLSSASLPSSSSTVCGAILPMPAVAREPRIALLYRSSARSSEILKQTFPHLIPHVAPERSTLSFSHAGQFLRRCCRVWVLYWCHQHRADSRFVVHCRYWPVRECPVLSR